MTLLQKAAPILLHRFCRCQVDLIKGLFVQKINKYLNALSRGLSKFGFSFLVFLQIEFLSFISSKYFFYPIFFQLQVFPLHNFLAIACSCWKIFSSFIRAILFSWCCFSCAWPRLFTEKISCLLSLFNFVYQLHHLLYFPFFNFNFNLTLTW